MGGGFSHFLEEIIPGYACVELAEDYAIYRGNCDNKDTGPCNSLEDQLIGSASLCGFEIFDG